MIRAQLWHVSGLTGRYPKELLWSTAVPCQVLLVVRRQRLAYRAYLQAKNATSPRQSRRLSDGVVHNLCAVFLVGKTVFYAGAVGGVICCPIYPAKPTYQTVRGWARDRLSAHDVVARFMFCFCPLGFSGNRCVGTGGRSRAECCAMGKHAFDFSGSDY